MVSGKLPTFGINQPYGSRRTWMSYLSCKPFGLWSMLRSLASLLGPAMLFTMLSSTRELFQVLSEVIETLSQTFKLKIIWIKTLNKQLDIFGISQRISLVLEILMKQSIFESIFPIPKYQFIFMKLILRIYFFFARGELHKNRWQRDRGASNKACFQAARCSSPR